MMMTQPSTPTPRRTRWKWIAGVAVAMLVLWAAGAYLVAPAVWKRYAKKHPSFEDVPNVAHTASGIPADPLNVALVGTKEELMQGMVAAKWYPADDLSFKSCLEIAEATVLRRPYDEAPVSSEYLFGRKEDLAFEKPVGDDPRQRHHVRFWKTDRVDSDGRPVWIGSAIYDRAVGLSHTTGQFTHHTGADVDAERDYLFNDLEKAGRLTERYVIDDFHKVREGKNGEGDPWRTDGRLFVGVLAPR